NGQRSGEANCAQNSMAAVSAEGSTVWVLMRRLNSSCDRSMMFVERAPFHLARRQASEREFSGLLEAVGNRALLEPAIYDRSAERCAGGLSSAGTLSKGQRQAVGQHFFGSPTLGNSGSAQHFRETSTSGLRCTLRQRVGCKKTMVNDFIIRLWGGFLSKPTHHKHGDVVAAGHARIEKDAMQDWRLGQGKIAFFGEFASKRGQQRLTDLHATSWQMPTRHIAMPDQKDAALPINDHRLHAQGQGTGISRKETRQAMNERFAAGHLAISNTRLVPRSRQLRCPPMRPVLRCHLAPGRTPMRRPPG